MTKYISIVVIALAIILIVGFRNKLSAMFTAEEKKPTTDPGNTSGGGGGSAALDYNKMLHKGSKGSEVKLLQGWLGVTTDGDFGPVTEAALEEKKCVKSITLTTYNTTTCPVNGSDDEKDEDNTFSFWGHFFGW